MNEKWYIKRFSSSYAAESKTDISSTVHSFHVENVKWERVRALFLSLSITVGCFLPLHTFRIPHFVPFSVSITFISFFYSHKIHNMKENCGKCYVRWESSCSELVFNAHPHACIRLTALIHSSIFQLILSALFRIVRVAFAENGAWLRDARLWMILWSRSKQHLCVYYGCAGVGGLHFDDIREMYMWEMCASPK